MEKGLTSHTLTCFLFLFQPILPSFLQGVYRWGCRYICSPQCKSHDSDLTSISLATRSHLFICHYIHHELKAKSSCVLKETSFDRGVPDCRGRRLSSLGVGRMCSFFFLLLGLGVFCWELSSLCYWGIVFSRPTPRHEFTK